MKLMLAFVVGIACGLGAARVAKLWCWQQVKLGISLVDEGVSSSLAIEDQLRVDHISVVAGGQGATMWRAHEIDPDMIFSCTLVDNEDRDWLACDLQYKVASKAPLVNMDPSLEDFCGGDRNDQGCVAVRPGLLKLSGGDVEIDEKAWRRLPECNLGTDPDCVCTSVNGRPTECRRALVEP